MERFHRSGEDFIKRSGERNRAERPDGDLSGGADECTEEQPPERGAGIVAALRSLALLIGP